MEWIPFGDPRLTVRGRAWFDEEKPSVRRLPERLKPTFPEAVWNLAQSPAGGRICFRTDSMMVGLRAQAPDTAAMPHMTLVGSAGFDIYADGFFMGMTAPAQKERMEAVWKVGAERRMRDIIIHMPLYKPVSIESVGLEDGSRICRPRPLSLRLPVVFYGTSITQGGCASTPGTSYQAIVSRMLDIDHVNLGFSGNGRGEPELARAIGEIRCSCIVVDHWANILGKLGRTFLFSWGPYGRSTPAFRSS